MRAWKASVITLVLLFVSGAPSESENTPERESRAKTLLDHAESVAGRAFDPRFRDKASRYLARLRDEELAEREARLSTAGLGELGTSALDLTYTAVAPCRIADTRTAGGSLAPGSPRDFRVTGPGLQGQGGNSDGCNIPVGSTKAAMLNFVAVNPVGAGNLRAWAYSTPPAPPPIASILNYALIPGAGLNIANGIAVAICDVTSSTCPLDLRVQADGQGTHLVIDVVGYFHEGFAPPVVVVESPIEGGAIGLTASCTQIQQLTVQAPTPGVIVVEARISLTLSGGGSQRIVAFIENTSGTCSGPPMIERRTIDDRPYFTVETKTASRVFTAASGGNYTFYLNARAPGEFGDRLVNERQLMATFYPQ